jgi:NADPH:quinone reductase-like Zn-dependent oxidoreductase
LKTALAYRYGPPLEVVEMHDVDRPTPSDDQVLVQVHAASVNRADLDGLAPKPNFVRLFVGLRKPRRPWLGIDVAGVVESVGSAATRFKPGDRVFADLFGHDGPGSFSELVCASETKFQLMPEGMGFEEAATLPHSAVLAVQGLRRRNGTTIKPGDKVLISGASGNVGPFAIQVAKALGGEVTGVASRDKLDLVRSIGADHVIDYTTVDYTKAGDRYDWIVDTDSHHSVLAARRALRPKGVYVTLGGNSWPIVSALVLGSLISLLSDRYSALMTWWKPFHPPDVDRLKELIAAGKIKPVIDRRFPLDEVAQALDHVHQGRARGKVVVTMEARRE